MTMTHRVGTWVAATLLSVTSGLVPMANAQERPEASAAPSPQAKPAGGLGQGIKVHGRWTVEVRNPDGSVASRHEFDNALTGTGGFGLTGLLARQYVRIRDWQIELLGPGVCNGGCSIFEFFGAGEPPVGLLSARVPTGESDLRLKGSLQVTTPGTIQSVQTLVYLCADTACTNVTAPPFTSHVLSSPIEVVSGQIVQVTVVFSFS